MPDAPLILTVALDAKSQAFFNGLRQQYFPPERNYLDAHLTLFHQLPAQEVKIVDVLKACSKNYSPINLKVTDIVSIGNGIAYKIENPSLLLLHKHLQQQWQPWLIPQDQQKLWPHITIQNKVDAAKVQILKDQLSAGFTPFEIIGVGLSLWAYLGGPWRFIKLYQFDL